VEDLAGVEEEETTTEGLVLSTATGSGQAQECILVPGPDAIVPGMADDKTKTGPWDAQRVNVHEEYEVRYWCEKFGCTEERLKAAVENVGVMADAVE
jgi:hypothetical protein